ncbi:hypothetical protein DV702_03585 [Sporosarcina sp. PTS2304]|uniref:cell wall elongation regulator TseB-like domain-containing protein n=1 Tax=Sporosarcina sp. PTS2304 TaxID=2283194 RepID=UPI000E0D9094|nr:DUF5590 domain-containing protein [Sporosarcina sp. PTS2304]AXH98888.1 hypothetical protein DV702_03585 [Sporosarcina sp. PTS2304]
MLNWIKFLSVFLLTLFVTITIFVLYQANKPFASSQEHAIEVVLNAGELVTVEDTTSYRGNSSLIAVYGTDRKGKFKALLVDEKSSEIVRTVTPSKGITKQQATAIVKKEKPVKKILHTSLGMEKDRLLWEVCFISEDDTLNYAYLDFTDGKWQKQIMNL